MKIFDKIFEVPLEESSLLRKVCVTIVIILYGACSLIFCLLVLPVVYIGMILEERKLRKRIERNINDQH